MDILVSWRSGVWWIGPDQQQEPLRGDGYSLDRWLDERGAGRADLVFTGNALRQRFIHDFGPLPR